LSSIFSYQELTTYNPILATSSQTEMAIITGPGWAVIGLAIAVVIACLIFAAIILSTRQKLVDKPGTGETGPLQPMHEKATEQTANSVETPTPAGASAHKEAVHEEVPLTSPAFAATSDITEAKKTIARHEEEKAALPKPKHKKIIEEASLTPQVIMAPLGIVKLKIEPAEPKPGETVTISFKTISNSDVRSYYTITLRINGEVVAIEGVSLPRRATLPMSFTVVETLPGDYQVEVNHSTSKFTVR